jgi:hypothetical protein
MPIAHAAQTKDMDLSMYFAAEFLCTARTPFIQFLRMIFSVFHV